ncbi:MAG: DnaD domain protein [Oscillospiraceae bacterium]|nr:DnaD domain protein [Oscillospiraceae bacterium]
MKLEQSKKNILFETTELPDVFFTDYLPMTNSDFVKVYLYILFLSKYEKEVKAVDLSKILNLSLPIVNEAIKFWEENNIIIKTQNSYVVKNIQEIALNKLYNMKVVKSSKDIEDASKNQYREKAIENINSSFFQGVMSPTWYNYITLWFDKYSFDEQVMISLFQYCFNKSALHKNYIQTVANDWSKNNVKTYVDLDLYFQKKDKLSKIKKTIGKKLGLFRELTSYEQEYIEKWVLDFGYSLDVIELALKKTTSKANPNFEYLDKLISDWYDRKFKTSADVSQFLEELKQKKKTVKQLEKRTPEKIPAMYDYNGQLPDDLDYLFIKQKNVN